MIKGLLLIALIFLVCCSKTPNGDYFTSNGKLKVLSTTAMIDNLVEEIGGDLIDHVSLIVGNLDPHSYELVKGDDEKLERADLIFFNGLGLEHGASLRSHLEKNPQSIGLGDLLYHDSPMLFLTVDGQLDPHFWMDIALFSKVVDPIVEALSEKAPEHALRFQERGKELKQKMLLKDRQLTQVMEQIPLEKRYLVSSHDAFYYFARKYLSEGREDWRARFKAPEGLAPDGQMSILDIKEVSDFLCLHQISVVFPESNINQDALKKIVSICKEKGLDVKIATTPLYGDAMGGKGSGAESYLEMIEHNVQALSLELKNEDSNRH